MGGGDDILEPEVAVRETQVSSREREAYPSDQPVRRIPTDPPVDEAKPGLALCLSGGGYRAMLFHLGALWRLNELGYLPRINRFSSVSGGSITAALLAKNWELLEFNSLGEALNFEDVVVRPIRHLADRTIDRRAVLVGLLSLGRLGNRTACSYRRHLLHTTRLSDLRTPMEFVFNATNLQSGQIWRFSKGAMADWRVGKVLDPTVSLATAVAASSAFPPFLSPVILRLKGLDYEVGSGTDLQSSRYRTRVLLTDGGVYDNLGVETAWKLYQTVLVSDAGGATLTRPRQKLNWVSQLMRVTALIQNEVTYARKQQVLDSYVTTAARAKARKGTYWGIRSHIQDYGLRDALLCDTAATTNLAAVKTRLKRLDPETQDRLINWGYAICDAAMRRWVTDGMGRTPAFPFEGGVG